MRAAQRIDCAPNGRVALVIRANGELKQFSAAAFSDIDFVSYRNDLTGSINCGDRKPADVVVVTWVRSHPCPPASPADQSPSNSRPQNRARERVRLGLSRWAAAEAQNVVARPTEAQLASGLRRSTPSAHGHRRIP